MKTIGAMLPIVILSMIFIGVWGLGMLAVKASATSTQISIDLLRQHLEVARIHDRLLAHSKQHLESHLEQLAAAGLSAVKDSATPHETSAIAPLTRRPWPASRESSRLQNGLRQAQPIIGHLATQYDQAVRTPQPIDPQDINRPAVNR